MNVPVIDLPETVRTDTLRQTPSLSVRDVRRAAAEKLGAGNRRLPLIWVSLVTVLITLVVFFALLYLENAVVSLMNHFAVGEVFVGLFAFLWFSVFATVMLLLVAPLWTGLVPYAVALDAGAYDAADFFSAFLSLHAYGRALSRIWEFVWRLAVTVASAFLTVYLTGYLSGTGGPAWVWVLFGVIGAVPALLCLLLFGGQFLAPYLCVTHPDWTLRRCRRASRAAMRTLRIQAFGFHLTFIGLALLSLLTLGIALFAMVIPLWLLSYAEAARRIAQASGF